MYSALSTNASTEVWYGASDFFLFFVKCLWSKCLHKGISFMISKLHDLEAWRPWSNLQGQQDSKSSLGPTKPAALSHLAEMSRTHSGVQLADGIFRSSESLKPKNGVFLEANKWTAIIDCRGQRLKALFTSQEAAQEAYLAAGGAWYIFIYIHTVHSWFYGLSGHLAGVMLLMLKFESEQTCLAVTLQLNLGSCPGTLIFQQQWLNQNVSAKMLSWLVVLEVLTRSGVVILSMFLNIRHPLSKTETAVNADDQWRDHKSYCRRLPWPWPGSVFFIIEIY